MTNLLTRAYNSTLGIPQQVLYRLWRAMKEDDVDVLSREGLLAPELLPVLGIGFSHETDVKVEELIGDQHGAVSFAADVFLDPATYLTAGASALGKAGRATQLATRAKKGGQEFVEFVGDTAQYGTANDLANKILEGVGSGALKDKSAKKAAKFLGEVGDQPLDQVLKSGRDEELLFSIPGLSRLGAQWRAPEQIQQQGSWFKAMSNLFYKQKLGLAKPIDWTIGQAATAINRAPGGDGLTKAIATAAGLPGTFVKGFKSTKGSANEIVLGQEVGDNILEWNEAHGAVGRAFADVDAEQFQEDFATAVAGGADAEKAAYQAAKKQGKKKVEVDALVESYGADGYDDIGALLPDLQGKYREVDSALESGKAKAQRTERYKIPKEFDGHPFTRWAWKAGDWAGEQVRGKFRSDTPIESANIEEAFGRYESLQGLADMSARDTLRIFDTLKRRLASDNGVELENVDRFWFSWQQAFPHAQEIQANLKAIQSGDLSAARAGTRQFTQYVNRLDASILSLQKHSGVQDLEDLTKLLGADTTKRIVGPQGESIKLMAADVTDPKAVKDLLRKRISDMAPEDIKRLRSVTKDPVLRARLKNIEARFKKGKPANVAESLERGIGKARFGGKPLKEGPAAAMADYLLATREMKRALKKAQKTGEPVRLSPVAIKQIERAQDALQQVLRETAGEVFKKSKPDDIDSLIGLSDKVANQAAKINGFERGAIIGYAPRIHNRKFRERYAKLIGKAQRQLGGNREVDAMFARVAERDLTIEDLNLLKEELIRADMPDLVDELTDIHGEFIDKPYVESWEAGILTRMSQQGSQVAARKFVNEVFSNPEAAAKDGIIGGRVTRLIDAAGQTVKVGKRLVPEGIEDPERVLRQLPKVAAGKVRVFRAESPSTSAASVFNLENLPTPKGQGEFWTRDLGYANYYKHALDGNSDAKIFYRDVDPSELTNPSTGGKVSAEELADNVKWSEFQIKPKTRLKIGGKESATLKREEIAKDLTPRAVEVQLPDGKYQIIDLREYKDRFGEQGIQVLGTEGDDLGQAMIRHEARAGGRVDAAMPEVGSWIMAGEGGVVDFIRQSGVPQKVELGGLLAGYDWVNFAIKKFQTVFRASHHAGNLISGLAQTRAAGASWGNTMLGHADAMRIMGLAGPDGAKAIDDLSALSGGSSVKWNPINRMADRAKIVEGLIAGKTVDELEEFSVLEFGLNSYGAAEIMQRATARNLFGGIQAVEDIKIGGFDPQGVVKEQAKLRGGKATRATETLLDATRAPEITARTATLFALLREGHSLDDAIDVAKLAHVDYSDLTKFERNGMKRAIPYYTFSRKYVPFALDRMAKDPSLIVGWQKTFENSDMFGIDENGTPVLSMGKFEADIGRLNANVDAMMALAGTVELMSGTVGSEIQQVQRPGFASFSGGALSPLLAATGAGSEEGASVPAGLQEMWDAVFVTRFVEGTAALARGEGGQKLGDSALSWILPARFNAEPDKARQFQLNVARRVMRRLELQAQEATTEAQLASLRRQAAEIKQAIKTVQQDFGQ